MALADLVVGALPDNRSDPDLRFQRLTSDTIGVVGRAGHPLLQRADRGLADYAAAAWALPGRAELIRQRLDVVLQRSGFGQARISVESDSLSLLLDTLRMTDCLGLSTSQTLRSERAQGLVAIDLPALRFQREAGLISRRHARLSPAVTLLAGELQRVARRERQN
jgi:DNA-binding transcriptional LysR family regulator